MSFIVVDLAALLESLSSVDIVAGASELVPGQPFSFAWRANPATTRNWIDAQIELFLVNTATGEDRPLWRRQTGWPPSLIAEPSPVPPGGWSGLYLDDGSETFPPTGYILENPYIDEISAPLVYHGFGTRQFRLTATGTLDGSRTARCNGTFPIEIVREPNVRSWARPVVPTRADWNTSYPIGCRTAANAQARVHADVTVLEQADVEGTETALEGSVPRPGRFTPVDTHIADRLPTWRWLEKPQYHASDELRQRTYGYVTTVTWSDEYGNRYDPVTLPRMTVTVRVSDVKWLAAAAAEMWFWVWIIIAAMLAIGAAILGIGAAVASAAAAGVAAGTAAAVVAAINFQAAALGVAAAIAGLLSGAAGLIGPFAIGFWQEHADDPPLPRADYWLIASWPAGLAEIVLKGADELKSNPALNPEVVEILPLLVQLPYLATAASVTYGRVLGARREGVASAAALQHQQLVQLHDQIVTVMQQLPKLTRGLLAQPPSAVTLSAALDDAANKWQSGLDPKMGAQLDAGLKVLRANTQRGARILANADYPRMILEGFANETLRRIGVWLNGTITVAEKLPGSSPDIHPLAN